MLPLRHWQVTTPAGSTYSSLESNASCSDLAASFNRSSKAT